MWRAPSRIRSIGRCLGVDALQVSPHTLVFDFHLIRFMLSWPWVQIRSDYSKLSYWTYERQKDLFSAFKGHFLENGKKAKPQATVFQSRGVLGPVETLEIIESASPWPTSSFYKMWKQRQIRLGT